MANSGETALDMAKRHVVEGERRCSELAELLGRTARPGLAADEGEIILQIFRETLVLMREHQLYLQKKVERWS